VKRASGTKGEREGEWRKKCAPKPTGRKGNKPGLGRASKLRRGEERRHSPMKRKEERKEERRMGSSKDRFRRRTSQKEKKRKKA